MIIIRLHRTRMFKFDNKGFSLVELIVVIAILGIIIAIAVPRLVGYRSLAMERVCESNRDTALRLYEVFLQNENRGESSFNRFMIENFDKICPSGGVITYEEGKVKCSLHKDTSDNDVEEPPGDEVPWL